MKSDEPGDAVVTAETLAEWLACSPYNARELAARGVIERAGRGRYPLKGSIRAYAEHMRRVVVGRGEGTAAAERGRLARAHAILATLKAKRMAGALVDAEQVEHEWRAILTALRSRLMAIPSRLPHLTRADLEALDVEIRSALEELADDD